MQQTHFTIETNGAKVKTLDADGNGQFIALMENGHVIAHDFKVALIWGRHQLPQEYRYPMIRRLDKNRFLICETRTNGWPNGKVYDLNGQKLYSLFLGDAIEDLLICGKKIVATYFDEGVCGKEGPNENGLTVFSFDGKVLYGYNEDAYNNGKFTEKPYLSDCYAVCRINPDLVAFYMDDCDLISYLDLTNYTLDFHQAPNQIPDNRPGHGVGLVDALSLHERTVIVHASRTGSFYWWEDGMQEMEIIPEKLQTPQKQIQGINGGKFLLQQDFGYTVIDPLALSIKETLKIGPRRLELVLDDITNQHVHAIVNAANSQLAGGFGVDGAIHRRGGPAIMKETRERYPFGCQTGSAVPSNGGNLNARYVFHAVGPRWFDDPHRFDLLQSTYSRCLELAVELNCQSIAFPSISTGDFGFPVHESADVAIKTICEFLQSLFETNSDLPLECVRFCLFSEKDLACYQQSVESCRSGNFDEK